MRFKKRYFFLPFLAIFSGYLLFSVYDEVKTKTIEEFNTQQIIIAKQAAKGIKSFFEYYLRMLNHFSQNEDIVVMNDNGKSLMASFYDIHSDVISAVTRVNRDGRIAYTIPFNKAAINADISKQKHMQVILRDHTPVISDVFKAVQGYLAVAYHVPIFFNNTFQGTLAILIPFSEISEEYLGNIRIGEEGYAWVISKGGIELFNPKSSHVGRSVFESYKKSASMIRMFDEMVAGKQGNTTYEDHASSGIKEPDTRKHAVYLPIFLANTFWSIVVATPEKEVLSTMKGFRNKFLMITTLLMIVGVVFSYFLIKAWAILKEETKRKSAEAALSKSEQKYRLLADNVIDMIWTLNIKDQRITYISPAVKKIRGFTPEEVMSQSLEEILTPDSRERVMRVLAEELDSNGDSDPDRSVIMEIEQFKKDGGTVWTEIMASFVRDEQNNPIEVLGVARDITERMLTQKALRESEEKLARSKKMESLGLLAGGVAHDLNNVLSGIVSYPDLLLMDLPADSKLKKPIETIQESGKRAAAIVQDLLTVARGVAIAKQALNINELVDTYLHSPESQKLKQFYPEIEVKTRLEKGLFNILGSDVHISKMLMNLVSNAAEAIGGGGTITIATMNRYVDQPIKGYNEVSIGEYVVLSVSDDGPGIFADDLERIFEPFYTKKVMGRSGTGLGLAVVWNIVVDHKGYIDVETGRDGTVFELYFPVTREAKSEQEKPINLNNIKGNGEKVLVVDDIESQREIACMMLATLGYQTGAVASGEEAVEYMRENTADLILLDMIMDPGINGRETFQRIIKMQPHQKAIIVSGFAVTDDVKAAQKLGAGKYIKKPYTIEELGLAVKKELGN